MTEGTLFNYVQPRRVQMKIALDYDNTFTQDPEGWRHFIRFMYDRGHDVVVVTVRDDRHDRTEPLIALERVVRVIYTRGVAKRWYCQHFGDGFVPDVWIDDKPESILANSTFSPEALAEWRANREH